MQRWGFMFLLVALSLAGLNAHRTDSKRMRILMGKLENGEVAILRRSGASFEVDECGFWIRPNDQGACAIYRLCRYSRLQLDLVSENLANLNTTKTADGMPYRPKYATLDDLGNVQIREVSRFRYVYDPTNPNAEKMGEHKGYVAMPDINAVGEGVTSVQALRTLSTYERALEKMERLDPRLVCAHTAVPLEEVSCDQDNAMPYLGGEGVQIMP